MNTRLERLLGGTQQDPPASVCAPVKQQGGLVVGERW